MTDYLRRNKSDENLMNENWRVVLQTNMMDGIFRWFSKKRFDDNL